MPFVRSNNLNMLLELQLFLLIIIMFIMINAKLIIRIWLYVDCVYNMHAVCHLAKYGCCGNANATAMLDNSVRVH